MNWREGLLLAEFCLPRSGALRPKLCLSGRKAPLRFSDHLFNELKWNVMVKRIQRPRMFGI